MENVLVKWFTQTLAVNIPVDGTAVHAKATYLAQKLGLEDFKASNSWIERFKSWYNLVHKRVRGEARSISPETVEAWKDTFPSIIENYSPNDIFNADERGVFFLLMPDKMLDLKGEKCHGVKFSKERLTVLLCCNVSGTGKLLPLVIIKAKSPQCFKNMRTFLCKYTLNTQAWVMTSIF